MDMRESELRQLARRYDDHLAESGVSDLELGQQEIRESAREGKAPSVEAEQKLLAWGRQQGLIGEA
jgi:hypothetical protein